MDTLWAIVLGAVVAVLGGFLGTIFSVYWAVNTKRGYTRELLGELLLSVLSQFQKMQEEKSRSQVISIDMLIRMQSDVTLYERNREDIVYVKDQALRSRLRDLFTKTAYHLFMLIFFVQRQFEILQRELRDSENYKHVLKQSEQYWSDLKDDMQVAREVLKVLCPKVSPPV